MIKYLNEVQLEKFNKTLKRSGHLRDILLFELVLKFGLRVSEALQIRIDDVNFESQEIVIRALKRGYRKTYHIDAKLLKKISKYISEYDIDDQLFSISRVCVYKNFKRHLRRAKLPNSFTVHSLRHTTAFYMVRKGFSPYEVKSFLRHKSILSTQVYFEGIAFENLSGKVGKMFSEIF